MPEYFGLRLILSPSLGFLATTRVPRQLRSYCAFVALCQLIPQQLYAAEYWRRVWLPLECIQAALALLVCATLFRRLTEGRTYPDERTKILLASGSLAICLVLVGWLWVPQNWFQQAVTVRQYYRLGLLTSAMVVVLWFTWLRPVAVDRSTRALCAFWLVWLACQFAMSTTGAGGLLWVVAEWKGGLNTARAVADTAMVVQIVAAVWCGSDLRKAENRIALNGWRCDVRM